MPRNPEIDDFLNNLNHPLHNEIQRVREIILDAHPGIEESIKWKSPTFMYKGNMASYFIKAKKHVSLMFHKGALIEDSSGLLQGDGKEARTLKLADMKEIERRKDDLQNIVRKWVKMQDEQSR